LKVKEELKKFENLKAGHPEILGAVLPHRETKHYFVKDLECVALLRKLRNIFDSYLRR
jgi:hypothetical protein